MAYVRHAVVGSMIASTALFAAGCGSSPAEKNAYRAAPAVSDEPTPAASPRRAERGVALPIAKADTSALFHAAYQRVESDWEQVLFLCDGVGGEQVKLITMPNARGLSKLWTYEKPGFRTHSEPIRVGESDPGAGQVMRSIERPDGSAFGNIHSINPGMLGGEEDTTLPTLSSIADRNERTRCRWAPRGRILFVDARRSVLVTADGDGFTYRSFDHDKPGKVIDSGGGASSRASTTVTGGRLVPAEPGREVYEFRKGPWLYRIAASADNRRPGASLTVLRDGRPVQTSTAAAYEMAANRIE